MLFPLFPTLEAQKNLARQAMLPRANKVFTSAAFKLVTAKQKPWLKHQNVYITKSKQVRGASNS